MRRLSKLQLPTRRVFPGATPRDARRVICLECSGVAGLRAFAVFLKPTDAATIARFGCGGLETIGFGFNRAGKGVFDG